MNIYTNWLTHLPPVTHTFLHLYSLSFICTDFPSFVLTSLHLYSLTLTLVPYMWASMTFLAYMWATMTFWPSCCCREIQSWKKDWGEDFHRPFWAIFCLTVDATACHVLNECDPRAISCRNLSGTTLDLPERGGVWHLATQKSLVSFPGGAQFGSLSQAWPLVLTLSSLQACDGGDF